MTWEIVLGGSVVVLLLGFAGLMLYGRAQRNRGRADGMVEPTIEASEHREDADRELAKPLPSGPSALDRLSRRRPRR